MKNLILPLALSLAGSMALAAPPAHHKMAPNARGVARATAVRSEVANENANGPRLVKHRRHRAMQARSARATVRAHSSANY